MRAEECSFSVTIRTDREQCGLGICNDHTDEHIAGAELDSLDAARVAAHRTGVGLAKSNCHSLRGVQNDLVTLLRNHDINDLIAIFQLHSDQTALSWAAVSAQSRLFHKTLTR